MADQAHGSSLTRLDAFVDAAFAFAVTLLVIGGGAVPADYAQLERAVANAPAFLVGFAPITMFWHAHVRWRGYGERAGFLPVLLSLAIVFLVLVYVYPLRLMAVAMVEFASGEIRTVRTAREVGSLFTLYGLGFMAMALAIAALFATSLKGALSPEGRAGVTGEIGIWLILAGSGALSALLSRVSPSLAPWVYTLLPICIPLFVLRHWRKPPAAAED
jgi:uncharacterized membrane protein